MIKYFFRSVYIVSIYGGDHSAGYQAGSVDVIYNISTRVLNNRASRGVSNHFKG